MAVHRGFRNKDCTVYIVGGYTNYVHILTSVHPSQTLADLVKDVKLAVIHRKQT